MIAVRGKPWVRPRGPSGNALEQALCFDERLRVAARAIVDGIQHGQLRRLQQRVEVRRQARKQPVPIHLRDVVPGLHACKRAQLVTPRAHRCKQSLRNLWRRIEEQRRRSRWSKQQTHLRLRDSRCNLQRPHAGDFGRCEAMLHFHSSAHRALCAVGRDQRPRRLCGIARLRDRMECLARMHRPPHVKEVTCCIGERLRLFQRQHRYIKAAELDIAEFDSFVAAAHRVRKVSRDGDGGDGILRRGGMQPDRLPACAPYRCRKSFFPPAVKERGGHVRGPGSPRQANGEGQKRGTSGYQTDAPDEAELKVAAASRCRFPHQRADANARLWLQGWFVACLLCDGKAFPAVTRAAGRVGARVWLEVAPIGMRSKPRLRGERESVTACGEGQHHCRALHPCTTRLRSAPIPLTAHSITSPACSRRPRAMPTPSGVPMQITSPGCSVSTREM